MSQAKISKLFEISGPSLKARINELKKFFPKDLIDQIKPQHHKFLKSESKNSIVKELLDIFFVFNKKYQYEFLIKDLLYHDFHQEIHLRIDELKGNKKLIDYELLNEDKIIKELNTKAEDKMILLKTIKTIDLKFNYTYFDELVKIFKIICDIRDFALGGTLEDIKNRYKLYSEFISSIATQVFLDILDFYPNRFYQMKHIENDLLSLAKKALYDEITERDFSNLIHPQFQVVINHYRKEKQIKLASNVFRTVVIDLEFTEWLAKISPETLNLILDPYKKKLTSIELLTMCAEINKGLEILKYVVYSLIKTPISIEEISKMSGKSIACIEKYKNLIYKKKIQI